MILAWLLACAPDATPDVPAWSPPPPVDPAAVLTRASVALRGRLPTLAELDRAVSGDLDAALDEVLNDEVLGQRVADLLAPVWRMRADIIDPYRPFGALQRSLADEPLRVLARVVDEDLPYTELVTADWTMADAHTASLWPLDRPADAEGWTVAHYTDDRPHAGVLTTNGMWWRYGTTETNLSRGRANAVTRIFACTDFTLRPVVLDRNGAGLTSETLRTETHANLACTNCHATIDGVASFLHGFGYSTVQRKYAEYDVGAEDLWRRSGFPPAWFGTPGWSLVDLGRLVASDPRFPTCAVQTMREALLRRPARPDEDRALVRHREAFLQGGLTVRALLRSLFTDRAWRAAGDGSHPDGALLMSPTVFARVVEDLTGFRWDWQGVALLESDAGGIRTLAGGADTVTVLTEATTPTPTQALAYARVAELAARHAVATDAARPDDVRLLDDRALVGEEVDPAMARLVRRVLGRDVDPDDPDLQAARALWDEARALGLSPADAWAAVLAGLLSHADFVTY